MPRTGLATGAFWGFRMYLGLHNSNTVVSGSETALEIEKGNKSLQRGVTLPVPPASESWTERKRLLRELERREVTGSNPTSHHGNRIKEGWVVKEKLCWEEGGAVLHCWRKARGQRRLREDAPRSAAGLAASPTRHSREAMTSLGWGGQKKASKTPPSIRKKKKRGEKEGREEVGSLRACPAERKGRRSRSIQGAFPRAGSARSRGQDKGIAH